MLRAAVQSWGIGFVERCDLPAPRSESLRITKPNGGREAFRKLIDDWAEWTIGTQIV